MSSRPALLATPMARHPLHREAPEERPFTRKVYGKEWCFGASQDDESSVGWVEPGLCDQHHFRESLYMGSTKCTPDQVEKIIEDMGKEWTGTSYDMLTRSLAAGSQREGSPHKAK